VQRLHIGNFAFESRFTFKEAIRHYEVGVRLGEAALGADFDGVLPWGLIDNRPFLRCLHGFGLDPVLAQRERDGAG
jgi:hypothetical protein